MASMGSDVISSAKHMWSSRCSCLLHITWSLHPSSVDTLVDVHGRSHYFLLIHPGKSYWPGIGWLPNHYSLVVSPYLHFPWKLACMGWGWYICPMHDGHLCTRKHQPLTLWEEASFGGGCVTVWVGLSLHRRGHHNLIYHLTCFLLPPIPNLPLSIKGISLH